MMRWVHAVMIICGIVVCATSDGDHGQLACGLVLMAWGDLAARSDLIVLGQRR